MFQKTITKCAKNVFQIVYQYVKYFTSLKVFNESDRKYASSFSEKVYFGIMFIGINSHQFRF